MIAKMLQLKRTTEFIQATREDELVPRDFEGE